MNMSWNVPVAVSFDPLQAIVRNYMELQELQGKTECGCFTYPSSPPQRRWFLHWHVPLFNTNRMKVLARFKSVSAVVCLTPEKKTHQMGCIASHLLSRYISQSTFVLTTSVQQQRIKYHLWQRSLQQKRIDTFQGLLHQVNPRGTCLAMALQNFETSCEKDSQLVIFSEFSC